LGGAKCMRSCAKVELGKCTYSVMCCWSAAVAAFRENKHAIMTYIFYKIYINIASALNLDQLFSSVSSFSDFQP
jgi:hypothetical protein